MKHVSFLEICNAYFIFHWGSVYSRIQAMLTLIIWIFSILETRQSIDGLKFPFFIPVIWPFAYNYQEEVRDYIWEEFLNLSQIKHLKVFFIIFLNFWIFIICLPVKFYSPVFVLTFNFTNKSFNSYLTSQILIFYTCFSAFHSAFYSVSKLFLDLWAYKMKYEIYK